MSSSALISAEQLQSIANRACDDKVQVIAHRLEAYSDEKFGFLGKHQKLEISVKKRHDEALPTKLNFFVKSIPRDSDSQMDFVKQRGVFDQEAEFFTKLMPRLLAAVEVGRIEAWAPKCYLASDGLLVLEDVRQRAFHVRAGDAKTLSVAQLKSAARAMARMHAASMILERQLGKPLGELYPRACSEHIFTRALRQSGLGMTLSLIVEVAKRQQRHCDEPRVLEMIRRAFDFVSERGEHRVICHGDAWPNNVMLSEQPAKCLLVDYQMTRYAPRMFDLAQLICLSTHRDLAEEDEKSMIEAYRQELCETLSKCRSRLDEPTCDQLIDEYNEAKSSALLISVMYMPTVMLSKQVFLKHKDDPSIVYQKFVFRRDNRCVLELMDKDQQYARRIVETVLAFIDSGDQIAAQR